MIGGVRRAAVAAALGVMLFGGAAMRAARVESPGSGSTALPVHGTPDDPRVHRRALTPPHHVELAAEQNLFHPERRRGGQFRIPGDDPLGETGAALAQVAATVRLVGTVTDAVGSGFVVCAAGPEPPRVVRVGHRCGHLVLTRVARGRGWFKATSGAELILELPLVEP